MSSISVVKKTFNRLFSVIWILSACAIFVPLLFPDVQYRLAEISQAGIFGKTLRTSVLLKIFEGVSIGSTLPSLVNIFLDKISHASSKSELGSHYFSLLVMFGTGIVYLSCYDNDFTPYFYASSFCIKLQTLCSVVMYSALNGVIATEHKLHPVMFMLPTLTFAVLQIFVSFSLLFPEYKSLSAVRIPLYSFCVLVFFVCKVIWFYKLWCHYRINNYILEFEVKKEAIHMSTLWIFAIAFMAVNSIDNPSENIWINTNETILVVYCSLYVASSIVLTILPNRLLRTFSDIQEAALQLKREFVRYVSHEIRSPLNVAHAGLEILKAELEIIGVTNFIRDLLDDIFFASNTAIDILNDMLQYEYIDSGTFKLDLAVMPLLEAFKGRLGAYKFMASKKNITLLIEDHAEVSEFYESDVIELGNHLEEADNEDPMYLVLYIDKFRVEQIIRNLVSNAIKFTPEGGHVTMRFIRTEATAAADPSESKHPVYDLQDDLLVKKIGGYLRVEGFHSEGEGRGCTFYVEFPFYNRQKTFTLAGVAENDRAPVTDCGSSSLLATVSNSFSVISPPSPSCVFPEEAWYSSNGGADADIEMAVPRPQILIVDDSSANR
eukprot:gene28253-37169_t